MPILVALRKESVDRNYSFGLFGADTLSSLSARRAWIEIKKVLTSMYMYGVALRKESVDRNIFPPVDTSSVNVSLSARRAWIEILNVGILRPLACCRSPQGERG